MKTKEFVVKDEKHNNKKGFQLIVKNLDTGKDEFNVTTRAIVGAYAIDIGINGTMSAGRGAGRCREDYSQRPLCGLFLDARTMPCRCMASPAARSPLSVVRVPPIARK